MWRLFIPACLLTLLCACGRPSLLEQARMLGDREYTPQAWATASQIERGEMLASFLSKNGGKQLTATEVERMLGAPTGYADYDEDPAYVLGPSTVQSEYTKGYLLVFITDKETGRVVDIRLIPEVRK